MILPHIQVGDSMDISGPAGKVIYLGRGYIRVKYPGKPEQIRFATDVGLIAGGTGKGVELLCKLCCIIIVNSFLFIGRRNVRNFLGYIGYP